MLINDVCTTSAVSSKNSVSASPIGKGIGLGFGNSTWQSPINNLPGVSSPLYEKSSLWGGKAYLSNPQVWPVQSFQTQIPRPDDHSRSRSWCGEEERNGLPPVHPNRTMSFHTPNQYCSSGSKVKNGLSLEEACRQSLSYSDIWDNKENGLSQEESCFESYRFVSCSDEDEGKQNSGNDEKPRLFTVSDSLALRIEQPGSQPRCEDSLILASDFISR